MYQLGTGRIGGRCAALGLVAMLSACALSERAETLYLRQHRVAATLAETIASNEERDPPLADTLYAAEADLNAACEPLRHAGYLHLQAKEIDDELEWAIVNSLEACAARTDATEALLWRLSPDIAAFFLPPPSSASKQPPRLTQSSR